MKRVLVEGYYGMENTGDDVFLAVVNWGVKLFLKTNRIYATAAKIPDFLDSEFIKPIYAYKNRFKGENRLRAYLTSTRVQHVVIGGGSVFHSSKNLKRKINILKLSGKGPHVAIGVSIGPFSDSNAEKVCAKLLNRLSYVGLRDQISYDIAKNIAPNVLIEKTFDLALLFPHVVGISMDEIQPNNRTGIGLALCNYERFIKGDCTRENVRKKKIIQMFKQIEIDKTEEIVFIDFNGHPYYGDNKLHTTVANEIANYYRIRHIPYLANPISALKEIAKLRAIITMRLHAAIFGYMVQTPTIMLSYHPKCNAWAGEIGMPSELIFDSYDFDIDKLSNCIRNIISGNVNKPTLPITEAEKLAMKNWKWTNG
jgi:polysaccharide pyruvyl transferase WcaK-like protein